MPVKLNKKGKPRERPKFYLSTFKKTIDSKSLPLGYSGLKYSTESIPNDKVICDYQKCNVNDAESEVQRLLCFHTFHTECLEHCKNRCPMCTEYLSKTCDKLASQFNNSLLSSKGPEIILPEELEPDTSEDPCNQKITSDCDPEYYESDLWNKKVDTSLESFNVPQPRLPISVKHSQTGLLQTTTNNNNSTTSCENTNDQSSHLAKSSLLVQLTQYNFGNSSVWFFPMDIISHNQLYLVGMVQMRVPLFPFTYLIISM